MKYRIIGQTVPVVEVSLNNNESIYTQSGAMAYQTNNIEMTTNARGGVMQSLVICLLENLCLWLIIHLKQIIN